MRASALVIQGMLLATGIAFALWTARLWSYTVDDAYITFRYAENLVRGWGLTFNHAPPRAEGYTSVLWTLLMAIPHALRLDVVLFSKLGGLALMLGAAVVIARGILARPGAGSPASRRIAAAFAVALFLGFASAAVHAVSGMETALAAFLYATTAAFYLDAQDGRPSWRLPLSCLLLGLTRPEANLFSVLLLALLIPGLPTARRRGFAAACLAAYVVPGILYFSWRYRYYGMLLPLPFYAKSATFDLSGLAPTLSFLKNLVVGFAFPIAALARSPARRRTWILLPLACMLAYFTTTDHIMGYGHRYFFPLVPVFAILAGLGLSTRIESGIGRTGRLGFVTCLVLASTLGFLKTREVQRDYLAYARGMRTAHEVLGHGLAVPEWSVPPVIALGDAGAIPYYSELPTIDSFGLNDPVLARSAPGVRANEVLSRAPDVVVLISRHEQRFESPLPYEDGLWRACLARGYSRHVTLVFGPEYFLWVLWSPFSVEAPRLETVLAEASRRSHELDRTLPRP